MINVLPGFEKNNFDPIRAGHDPFKNYVRNLLLTLKKYKIVETEKIICKKPSGEGNKVDIFAQEKNGAIMLYSIKTQHVIGTAKQKLLYEHYILIRACELLNAKATIVVAGTGFNENEMNDFMSPEFANRIKNSHLINWYHWPIYTKESEKKFIKFLSYNE